MAHRFGKLLRLHRIEKYADDGIKVRVSDRDEINRKDRAEFLADLRVVADVVKR